MHNLLLQNAFAVGRSYFVLILFLFQLFFFSRISSSFVFSVERNVINTHAMYVLVYVRVFTEAGTCCQKWRINRCQHIIRRCRFYCKFNTQFLISKRLLLTALTRQSGTDMGQTTSQTCCFDLSCVRVAFFFQYFISVVRMRASILFCPKRVAYFCCRRLAEWMAITKLNTLRMSLSLPSQSTSKQTQVYFLSLNKWLERENNRDDIKTVPRPRQLRCRLLNKNGDHLFAMQIFRLREFAI